VGILNVRVSSTEFERGRCSIYLAENDVKHILLKCSGKKKEGGTYA
jgi:hypothetical protein